VSTPNVFVSISLVIPSPLYEAQQTSKSANAGSCLQSTANWHVPLLKASAVDAAGTPFAKLYGSPIHWKFQVDPLPSSNTLLLLVYLSALYLVPKLVDAHALVGGALDVAGKPSLTSKVFVSSLIGVARVLGEYLAQQVDLPVTFV